LSDYSAISSLDDNVYNLERAELFALHTQKQMPLRHIVCAYLGYVSSYCHSIASIVALGDACHLMCYRAARLAENYQHKIVLLEPLVGQRVREVQPSHLTVRCPALKVVQALILLVILHELAS